MFNYLRASKIQDSPFIILDEPVIVFKTNYNWSKEADLKKLELPSSMTLYLADETKAPWDLIKDDNGNEIYNLIYYTEEGLSEVNKKKVMPMDYNFFNYKAEVQIEQSDGTTKGYRRKWLDRKMRANVTFPLPCVTGIWDKETKTEVQKPVSHAKLDIPSGVYRDIMDKFETVKEAKENPDMKIIEVEVSVNYDDKVPLAECYTTKVKPTKAKINLDKALEEFTFKKEEYVPPATPF